MPTAQGLEHLSAREPNSGFVRAIVDTPKGSRNKYKYDEQLGVYRLSKILPLGSAFPYDFGFIPSTLAEDGDPLDIIVLMDAPTHVGCLLDVRLIGIVMAEQTEDGKTDDNDRLLGVSVHSYDHEAVKTIDDVSETLLSQVEEFFISYNKQRGKKFKVTGTGGPKKATKTLREGMRAYRARKK